MVLEEASPQQQCLVAITGSFGQRQAPRRGYFGPSAARTCRRVARSIWRPLHDWRNDERAGIVLGQEKSGGAPGCIGAVAAGARGLNRSAGACQYQYVTGVGPTLDLYGKGYRCLAQEDRQWAKDRLNADFAPRNLELQLLVGGDDRGPVARADSPSMSGDCSLDTRRLRQQDLCRLLRSAGGRLIGSARGQRHQTLGQSVFGQDKADDDQNSQQQHGRDAEGDLSELLRNLGCTG